MCVDLVKGALCAMNKQSLQMKTCHQVMFYCKIGFHLFYEASCTESNQIYYGLIYNPVRLFVCLFVRDSGKNHCTGRFQTLRDYKVGLQKCPPRVKIIRLAVLEEISFNFWFFICD